MAGSLSEDVVERRDLHRFFIFPDSGSFHQFRIAPAPVHLAAMDDEVVSLSYLIGALHDGTIHRSTVRICQKEESYVLFLRRLVEAAGGRAWTYREGRSRNLYVVEFSRSLLMGHRLQTSQDMIDFARGCFDTDGGVPSSREASPYAYYAQKDRLDLEHVRSVLVSLGIECGKVHNPSRRVDPDYWRFYVRRRSLRRFAAVIGSWHPRTWR